MAKIFGPLPPFIHTTLEIIYDIYSFEHGFNFIMVFNTDSVFLSRLSLYSTYLLLRKLTTISSL